MTRRITARATVAFALWLATAAAAQPKELKPGVWFVPGVEEHPRNAGWVEFEDHVLLIDAGHPWAAARVVEAVRRQSAKPIRFAVETTGGAPRPGAAVETGATALIPEGRGGPGVTFVARTTLTDGEREVVLIPLGRAASRRDVAVWLPKEKVLFAGDVLAPSDLSSFGFPEADFTAWLAALERLRGLGAETAVGGGDLPAPLRDHRRVWGDVLEVFVETLGRAAAPGSNEPLLAAKSRAMLLVGVKQGGVPAPDLLAQIADQCQGRTPPRQLLEVYGLREGPSPTRETPGWVRPRKVVVVGGTPERAAWLGRAVDGVDVVAAADERAALAALAGADAVIGACSKAILEHGKALRWVQVGSAGVDRYVDLPGLRARPEVVLTNMQRIYGPEIAEHVFGMLLALTRGLTTSIPLQAKGVWGRAVIGETSPFVELRGKTLLVVGLGGIGTEVARLGHGLGMRVIATRSSRRAGPPFVERVGLAGELLAMTPGADVVVNCTPLTPATEGLFDAAFFAAMKPSAYFLNIGRGRSVETAALMKAIEERRIAGAGLDVTDPEPLPADHPLWRMERVVITPHVSARSDLRLERVWKLYRENLRRFVAGERLLNVVDRERGY